MTIVDLASPRLRRRRDDRFPGDLQHLAEVAGKELEDAPAQEIVRWAAQVFGERVAVTSSMADAVVAHLVSSVKPGVDVLFLNTGYHFAETIGTRDAVAASYDVNVIDIGPTMSIAQQDIAFGKDLWARDPDRCCALRKVQPLAQALAGFAAWGSGVRRDESATRTATKVVDWDARRGMVKVNPLAAWTQSDVDTYVAEHEVPVNPLFELGYGSIGCQPCTRPVAPGEDPRAGRWAGRNKVECGLHS